VDFMICFTNVDNRTSQDINQGQQHSAGWLRLLLMGVKLFQLSCAAPVNHGDSPKMFLSKISRKNPSPRITSGGIGGTFTFFPLKDTLDQYNLAWPNLT
jgi:hypothetical protein